MAKKKRIGSSKKDKSKKFSFSADNLELTNLIKTLETKKDSDIIPHLETEEKLEATDEQIEKGDIKTSEDQEIQVDTTPVSEDTIKKMDLEGTTIFHNIGVFLAELLQSYENRYDLWEDSTNEILSVLRKMQMVNEQNTQLLFGTIEKYQVKIEKGLERFKSKRDYVEQFVDTNFNEISEMLKKTLNILALQLREFKIKNQLNKIMLE